MQSRYQFIPLLSFLKSPCTLASQPTEPEKLLLAFSLIFQLGLGDMS